MTTEQSADTAAILQANQNQSRWLIEADTDRLNDLLADDFTAVHITGYEQSKDEWLEQIRSGRMAYPAPPPTDPRAQTARRQE